MADENRGKWKQAFERAKTRLDNIRETQGETVACAVDSFATMGSASLLGFLHGSKGGMPMVAGVPYDMLGAGLFSLFGFYLASKGKSYARHVVAVGSGMGAYWLGTVFAKMGNERREKTPDWKNRQLTTEEAQAANVQPRRPILAGRAGMGAPFVQRGVYA